MIRHYWLRFKHHFLSYPLAWIGKYSVKLIFKTCKIEVEGLERFIVETQQRKCILALWHNRMSIFCEFFAKFLPDIHYAAFLSKSRDGEPIARIVESYEGGSTIRVAHHLRHSALHAMIQRLKSSNDIVVITPDGPRGPRYKAKPGIFTAAKETNASIVTWTWEASRYWQFKTWDQFRLPKPFSTIKVRLGEPFTVSASLELECTLQHLERHLS